MDMFRFDIRYFDVFALGMREEERYAFRCPLPWLWRVRSLKSAGRVFAFIIPFLAEDCRDFLNIISALLWNWTV